MLTILVQPLTIKSVYNRDTHNNMTHSCNINFKNTSMSVILIIAHKHLYIHVHFFHASCDYLEGCVLVILSPFFDRCAVQQSA